MEEFLFKYIKLEITNLAKHEGIRYVNLIIYDRNKRLGSPDLNIINNEQLLEEIMESDNGIIENKKYYPEAIKYCIGLPLFVLGKIVGVLLLAGKKEIISSDKIRKKLNKIIKIASSYLLRLKINELSFDRWNKSIEIIGKSEPFLETFDMLEQFAFSEKPLLITGESGSGKEIFAKSHYLLGQRYGEPYLTINCAQFQDEQLVISELFGHKKGSFTGAISDKKGLFENADGGMIFLDEIGELSLTAQKMLLRVIENGEIRPLGSGKVITVNTAIISATHQNLEKLINQGKFREDLYYRLNVLPLHIPPLRDRDDDYTILLDYFLDKMNKKHEILKRFSREAIEFLGEYSFPGNVRELKNIVESGFWLSSSNVINLNDITTKLRRVRSRRTSDIFTPEVSDYFYRMVEGDEDFWTVVRKPFMDRDLNRKQVRAIIKEGMKQANSYKELLPMFNIRERDYKKFLNFINQHRLKPN